MSIKPGTKLFLGRWRSACLKKRAGVANKNRQHRVPLCAPKHHIPEVWHKKVLPFTVLVQRFSSSDLKMLGKVLLSTWSQESQYEDTWYEPQGALCFRGYPLLPRFGFGIRGCLQWKGLMSLAQVFRGSTRTLTSGRTLMKLKYNSNRKCVAQNRGFQFSNPGIVILSVPGRWFWLLLWAGWRTVTKPLVLPQAGHHVQSENACVK